MQVRLQLARAMMDSLCVALATRECAVGVRGDLPLSPSVRTPAGSAAAMHEQVAGATPVR